MSCLVEPKSRYDPKISSILGLENIQEGNNSQHYYKFHLYLKMMMVIIMNVKAPMWNQMYNITRTMKSDNQDAKQEGKHPEN